MSKSHKRSERNEAVKAKHKANNDANLERMHSNVEFLNSLGITLKKKPSKLVRAYMRREKAIAYLLAHPDKS